MGAPRWNWIEPGDKHWRGTRGTLEEENSAFLPQSTQSDDGILLSAPAKPYPEILSRNHGIALEIQEATTGNRSYSMAKTVTL
eukprot:3748909-Rhodomonas_salina.1